MLSALMCLLLTASAHTATDDPTIQFMATGQSWADSSFTGHAFVCLQLPTDSGIKEDCYGFYPKTLGAAIFGGPGIVDSEFNFAAHPPTRMSHVTVSVTKTITLAQRQSVLDVIDHWNPHFSLASSNCVSLANAVASAAGLNVPSDTGYETPIAYVTKLKDLNPDSNDLQKTLRMEASNARR